MEPFKNEISPDVVRLTAQLLARYLEGFDRAAFEAGILAQLEPLALKERVKLVCDALDEVLPTDLQARYKVMRDMLHPMGEGTMVQTSDETGLRGWAVWPLTQLVAKHGLADFDASLDLLKDMTKRFTAEFDVRPFIDADQPRALAIITAWADDTDADVRRLVSEGTRPRLPWGVQLKSLISDPAPMLPTLRKLRDDPSEYVRRSVANHLNDIAKDHPDLVVGLAQDWMQGAPEPRQKLVRHALRTLVKNGHPDALAAIGIAPPKIAPPNLTMSTPVVAYGEAAVFDLTVASTAASTQKLVIDYVLHFRKKSGDLAPKVFKWTTFSLAPDEVKTITRKHAIRPITTRTYYDGAHRLSVRINGQDFGDVTFDLTGVT